MFLNNLNLSLPTEFCINKEADPHPPPRPTVIQSGCKILWTPLC